MELIVNNKVWTKQRLLEAGIITDEQAMCERCGLKAETDYHRYYECDANKHIKHDDVTNTNYIAKEAKLRPHLACMWFRAIMPGNITSLPVGWGPSKMMTTTTTSSRIGSTTPGRRALMAQVVPTVIPGPDGSSLGQLSSTRAAGEKRTCTARSPAGKQSRERSSLL